MKHCLQKFPPVPERSAQKEFPQPSPPVKPTNQLFITVDDAQKERLEALLELSFWEKLPDGRTVLRICTSWATDMKDVDQLIDIL